MDGKSNGNSFGNSMNQGPGPVRDWRLRRLHEAQVTFWALV